jgi:predicted metal-dependent hydrolase
MNEIPKYILKRSKRAKRVSLAVYCDGNVVVTSPLGVRQSIVDKFVFEKKKWVISKIKFFNTAGSSVANVFSYEDYLKHKDAALALVKERVKFYNKNYQYSFNKIYIKNQKTRWGSCSKKQNLNFNYKILFLPEELRNYIIVHELCHLKEFNHSQKFWLLVGKIIPNYLEIRKNLRKHELFYI